MLASSGKVRTTPSSSRADAAYSRSSIEAAGGLIQFGRGQLPGLPSPVRRRHNGQINAGDTVRQPLPGLRRLVPAALGQRTVDVVFSAGPVRLGVPQQDESSLRLPKHAHSLPPLAPELTTKDESAEGAPPLRRSARLETTQGTAAASNSRG